MRPWNDARTHRQEFEVREITAQEVIEAVEEMKKLRLEAFRNCCDGYVFYTEWVKPYVSEEECIKYFADNGSVIVIDHQGREWWKGVQL